MSISSVRKKALEGAPPFTYHHASRWQAHLKKQCGGKGCFYCENPSKVGRAARKLHPIARAAIRRGFR